MDCKQHQIAAHEHRFRPEIPENVLIHLFWRAYKKRAIGAAVLVSEVSRLLDNDQLAICVRRHRKQIEFYSGRGSLPAVPRNSCLKNQFTVHIHAAGKVHAVATDKVTALRGCQMHSAGGILDFTSRLTHMNVRTL